MTHVPRTDLKPRLPMIDLARGLALVAMAVYHFSWDLSFFRLIEVNVSGEPGWRLFARLIAGSFLFLVGVSLVLASRGGLSRAAFLRRLALVAGAAALITLATWYAFPSSFIFFGILHHIALASLLALPFLKAPISVTAVIAAAVFALPFFFTHDVFAQPALLWTGLAPVPPVTNDYVPLFPWFGVVLAGVVAARLALAFPDRLRWAERKPTSNVGRLLVWGGKRSLWVYLIHQPVLLAVLWLVAQELGPAPAADDQSFAQSCQQSCTSAGSDAEFCTAFCGCAADSLKREGLWGALMSGRMNDVAQARVAEVTAMCRSNHPMP
ncbi:membrane protein [Agaricicola taiwanensis]|uniref:Membrane protein n=1 Tax=Agaricicola taiwanensis TaxID=591372 RepID=A0A8J2VNM0_9RHOB|nr:heparan-alpha-glucosaminide N-acetyltransferase [Agaricicola taiwanensis]GGE33024.1 membrane protein [Agaricicola taiwanensis]